MEQCFTKSLVRKRSCLVFRTNNSDFLQGSVTKDQLQHSFQKECEQVWPAQNRNWFCYNQVFPLNSFPMKILRYSTSVSGRHRYKKPWKQGCELVPLWRPAILLKETSTQVFSCKCCETKAYNFIKKRLQHRYFPVNIGNFLRIAFYRTPLVAASDHCISN